MVSDRRNTPDTKRQKLKCAEQAEDTERHERSFATERHQQADVKRFRERVLDAALAFSDHVSRIDPRRPPGGQPTCECTHSKQCEDGADKRERVVSVHAVQE
jgi:hypothetical protein